MNLRFAWLTAVLMAALPLAAKPPASDAHALVSRLLRDPTEADWEALERFDRTLTRKEFERRLEEVFDPERGLAPYLRFAGNTVAIYADPRREGRPRAVLRFSGSAAACVPPPVSFRSPGVFRRRIQAKNGRSPLDGLRIAIDPADIGGRWAKMEDRSVFFPGYGKINEGDVNVIVARLLGARLRRLGALVFLVRDHSEPVLPIAPDRLLDEATRILARQPWRLSELFENRGRPRPNDAAKNLRIAAGLFVTKTLEIRARADLVRRSFRPDLTIILQHNATPESGSGRLVPLNRNIFFVQGAYSPDELRFPEQRFRLLTKLLEDSTPTEIQVAEAIAARFKAVTGFPPVLYGNSANTRLVAPGDPYVVARNLAINREHDGPVVVTEPYFMNQPETLARLLAGDYSGTRRVAGKRRISIYREYADCVAAGVLDAYR